MKVGGTGSACLFCRSICTCPMKSASIRASPPQPCVTAPAWRTLALQILCSRLHATPAAPSAPLWQWLPLSSPSACLLPLPACPCRCLRVWCRCQLQTWRCHSCRVPSPSPNTRLSRLLSSPLTAAVQLGWVCFRISACTCLQIRCCRRMCLPQRAVAIRTIPQRHAARHA